MRLKILDFQYNSAYSLKVQTLVFFGQLKFNYQTDITPPVDVMTTKNLLGALQLCALVLLIWCAAVGFSRSKEDDSTISALVNVNYNGASGKSSIATKVNLTDCYHPGIVALEQASYALNVSFNSTFIPPYGYYIYSIDHVSPQPENDLYWLIYINHNFSQFYINNIDIQDGDNLTLVYQNCKPHC